MDAVGSGTPRYRKLGHGGRIEQMLKMRMTLDYQAERKYDADDTGYAVFYTYSLYSVAASDRGKAIYAQQSGRLSRRR
jgi:hypothetical protein